MTTLSRRLAKCRKIISDAIFYKLFVCKQIHKNVIVTMEIWDFHKVKHQTGTQQNCESYESSENPCFI